MAEDKTNISEQNNTPEKDASWLLEQSSVEENTSDSESDTEVEEKESKFNIDLIKNYPKSNKRIPLYVDYYKVRSFLTANAQLEQSNTQTMYISPYGLEFKTETKYEEGDLLKVDVFIPSYWSRKKKLVEYDYLANEEPRSFRILGRVVSRNTSGKRYIIDLETLVIDDLDKEILTNYIRGNSSL